MKTYLIIFLSLFLIFGCVETTKQVKPEINYSQMIQELKTDIDNRLAKNDYSEVLNKITEQINELKAKQDSNNEEFKIKIKTSPDESKKVMKELTELYGNPTMKISSFLTMNGKRITFRRYRFEIDKYNYVIAYTVEDNLIFIDTVNSLIEK